MESIPESGSSSEQTDESLEGLFESSWIPMVRLGTLIVGSQATAEDLVSDVFERFAKTATIPDDPFRYLRTAVINACRSYHRRRKLELSHRAIPPVGTGDTPLELFDVLDKLTGRQRSAIVMRYYLDLSESEIACVLKCRPGTVRTIVQRALVKLKKELSP